MDCRTECFRATSILPAAIHRRARSCARWSNICFRWRTASRSQATHRSAIAWSVLRSMRCRARLPTICGRTSTTRNRIRWSAACIRSRGPRTGRNRTCTAWRRTSAAAPQTSIRGGPSLRHPYLWRAHRRRPFRASLQQFMRRAKSAHRWAAQTFISWKRPIIPFAARCGSR